MRGFYCSVTDLGTLDLGDEARVLELHPVGLVEFGTDQEIQVLDLVIFPHECGC